MARKSRRHVVSAGAKVGPATVGKPSRSQGAGALGRPAQCAGTIGGANRATGPAFAGRGLGLRIRIMVLVDLVLVVTVLLTIAATAYQVNRALTDQLEREAQTTVRLLTRSIASAQALPPQVEAAIGDQMVAQARLTAYLVAVAERAGLTPDEIKAVLRDIADQTVLDEFQITDETAHAYLTNTDVDFTFSPSPIEQPQASLFFQLLNQKNGSVVQEARPRELDGKVFKYAGVSGVDRPRIVQVGYDARFLEELKRLYGVQGLVDEAVAGGSAFAIQVVDAGLNTVAVGQNAAAPAGKGAGTLQIQHRLGSGTPQTETKDIADATQAMATAAEAVLRSTQTILRRSREPEALVVTSPVLTETEGKQTATGAAIVYFSVENLQRVQREAILGGLILGGLMCVVGTVVSYWLAGRIVLPLRAMVRLAEEVADGSLSRRIEVRRPAELGQLESALGRMTENLRATIQRIGESARQLTASAANIGVVVGELNQTVSQQSAAVAETTSAMEELRTVSQQIAVGAQTVSDFAVRTQGDVRDGRQEVSETADRMKEIRAGNEASVREILLLREKAQHIGAVMNLIDDIATQTRLIAINASIEAAAAGEAGRRFGVVAGQVRRLADNVAQSTEEIRQRIREIQTATNELTIGAEQNTKKIDQGVALSQATQQGLDEIAARADQTTISASQISISTRQQQTAVEQVVEALHDLNAEVSRVAASSHQTAQVVADLSHLANTLNELVSLFDLGTG